MQLMVPNIAQVYFTSVLAKSEETSGLSDSDFDPRTFLPVALHEFEVAPLKEFGKAVTLAMTGDLVDVPDDLAEMIDSEEAEVGAAMFKDELLDVFIQTQGDHKHKECRMMWTALIYLGAKAIKEDKERFANDLKELGI